MRFLSAGPKHCNFLREESVDGGLTFVREICFFITEICNELGFLSNDCENDTTVHDLFAPTCSL